MDTSIKRLLIIALLIAVVFVVFLAWVINIGEPNYKNEIVNSNQTIIMTPTPVPTAVQYANVRFEINDGEQLLYNAKLLVQDEDGAVLHEVYSDYDGSFECGLPLNSRVLVTASYPERVTHEREYTINDLEQSIIISLLPVKNSEVKGKVVDPQNAPVENALVSIFQNDQSEPLQQTTTTADGTFTFSSLAKGEFLVQATHDDYLAGEQHCKSGDHVVIALAKDVTIDIKTIDDQGNPVAGTEIMLNNQGSSNGLISKAVESDIRGKANFAELRPDVYQLTAKPPFAAVPADATVNTTTKAHHVVTMVLERKTFVISGKVMDESSGAGIADATVQLNNMQTSQLVNTATTNMTGEYRMDDVPLGHYQIYVDKVPGYISGKFDEFSKYGASQTTKLTQFVDQNINDYDFYLKKSWKIIGSVYDPQNQPLKNLKVNIRIYYFNKKMLGGFVGSDLIATINTDDEGKFEYEGQFTNQSDATTVTVQAKHHLYGSKWSDHFPIVPGEIHEVEIHLDAEPNLKGFVMDESGNPIANATIRLKSPDLNMNSVDPWRYRAVANDEGEYGIQLEPATYYYFVKSDDYTLDGASDTIEINEGQTLTKNFTVKEGEQKKYIITTLDDNRSPLMNIDIYVSVPNKNTGAGKIGNTDENGQFVFDLYKYLSPLKDMMIVVKAIPPHDMDYEEKSVTLDESQREVVMILEEAKRNITSLQGRVVDQQNNPVQEYQLMLIPTKDIENYKLEESIYCTWIPVRSSDGTFKIDNVSADHSYTLAAMKDQTFAVSDPIEVQSQKVAKDIVIVMESPIEITGKVINAETKEPIAGMEVFPQIIFDFVEQSQQGRDRRAHMRGLNFGEQTNFISSLDIGVTDEQGNFTMQNLPRKPMNLYFDKDEYGHKFISISPDGALVDVGTVEVEHTGQWRRRLR